MKMYPEIIAWLGLEGTQRSPIPSPAMGRGSSHQTAGWLLLFCQDFKQGFSGSRKVAFMVAEFLHQKKLFVPVPWYCFVWTLYRHTKREFCK